MKKLYIEPEFYLKELLVDAICTPSQIQDSQEIDIGDIIGGGTYNPW